VAVGGALRGRARCTRYCGAARLSSRSYDRLDADTRDLPLHEQVDHVIQASGLAGHYQKDKADKGEARLENLENW